MFKYKKKPHIHTVIKIWQENGNDCWLMSAKDFNCLYSGENVIRVNGKVMASLTFAGNPIIVYRDEKSGK